MPLLFFYGKAFASFSIKPLLKRVTSNIVLTCYVSSTLWIVALICFLHYFCNLFLSHFLHVSKLVQLWLVYYMFYYVCFQCSSYVSIFIQSLTYYLYYHETLYIFCFCMMLKCLIFNADNSCYSRMKYWKGSFFVLLIV